MMFAHGRRHNFLNTKVVKPNCFTRLFYIVLFLLFCRNVVVIYHLYKINSVDRLYSYSALFVGAVFIFWFILTHLNYKIDFLMLLFTQCVTECFSSTINSGTLKIPIMSFIYLCAIYCFSMYITIEKRFPFFLKDISILFLLLATINLFLMGSNGVYYKEQWYFLGLENQISFTLLLGLYFNWLNSVYNNDKITLLLYIIVYTASSVIIWSASAMLAVILFLLIKYVPLVYQAIKRMPTQVTLIVVVAILLFLVYYTLFGVENSFIKWLVVDILKKDITFTGRTHIWNILLKRVSHKPLFGYGIHKSSDIFIVGGHSLSAHNAFLAHLYSGGIVSMLIITLLFYISVKLINNIKSQDIKNIHKIMIFLISVPLMSEAVSLNSLYIMLFIGVGISVNSTEQKIHNKITRRVNYDT